MRRALFTLLLLSAAPFAGAATVYKWVDENGVIHYSDQPHANAEKVQIQTLQTYKPPAADLAPPAQSGPIVPPLQRQQAYAGCVIVQPQADSEFANVDSLNIAVQTDPVLLPGDHVFLTLDGAALNGGAGIAGSFTLSPVDRGTHTLQAVVRGADGSVRCQTPAVTFNVHQPSILNPANPIRRH
ncbi:MAG: DUF4124 domain-containing protein [Gammaproteobacteria bacterium]|nr:DUF4124 domain-containing protein [Gammaproteobacteria bacterium]